MGPDDDHDAPVGSSDSDQSLLAVGGTVVLAGEHGTVERCCATWQVDPVLAQILLALRAFMTYSGPAYLRLIGGSSGR